MTVEREPRLAVWIERLAARFADDGLPLIAGRIMGYLLVCDPPECTAADLSRALEASSGSISTNVRLLMNMGLVTKKTRRGRQAALYRIDEKHWADMVQRRMDALVGIRDLTREGMRLLSGDPHRAHRLRTVHELYAWLADELPQVWERRPQPPR
ncbi:GbsR/MarR family transcriptional regulator [Gandjariella thermophila]|uniref:HTH-type transcriptional regulator MmpR5 n=1 Tax=Gandjariella thermophila TaxID=1931992 RepID=A0A4D4J364_9PSEU|nr:helix-turn-helix domain-containing protein [Gandjariella thermophila]GDY28926.1 HTH-type transcriptional regulator MmpR5 [Gandjariella thermophila]